MRTILRIPGGRGVVAADPSQIMLGPHPGARRVRAVAGQLPFRPGSFAAAMAVMTVHHWPDPVAGQMEMRRVGRRQVVFTWDPAFSQHMWLVSEYLPQIDQIDQARFPPLSTVISTLDTPTVRRFEIPWDFSEGNQSAFWRRPAAYLDPAVRAASSTFAQLPGHVVESAMDRLERDLRSGAWYERHRGLLARTHLYLGHRLIVAG